MPSRGKDSKNDPELYRAAGHIVGRVWWPVLTLQDNKMLMRY